MNGVMPGMFCSELRKEMVFWPPRALATPLQVCVGTVAVPVTWPLTVGRTSAILGRCQVQVKLRALEGLSCTGHWHSLSPVLQGSVVLLACFIHSFIHSPTQQSLAELPAL